jgi:hypothetical protein
VSKERLLKSLQEELDKFKHTGTISYEEVKLFIAEMTKAG